ncbi:hypothetical protein E2C01_031548 [Portunus trituberculatus]|uniref:Uncharacterized protein n=1 Tax=Portunus trituberculatus TaxID=210409 RepID=A0A5B7EXZ0_PORTR|nr:hypothetical protein [Portunus trituberculatus]
MKTVGTTNLDYQPKLSSTHHNHRRTHPPPPQFLPTSVYSRFYYKQTHITPLTPSPVPSLLPSTHHSSYIHRPPVLPSLTLPPSARCRNLNTVPTRVTTARLPLPRHTQHHTSTPHNCLKPTSFRGLHNVFT